MSKKKEEEEGRGKSVQGAHRTMFFIDRARRCFHMAQWINKLRPKGIKNVRRCVNSGMRVCVCVRGLPLQLLGN